MELWPPHVTLLRDYKDLGEQVSFSSERLTDAPAIKRQS